MKISRRQWSRILVCGLLACVLIVVLAPTMPASRADRDVVFLQVNGVAYRASVTEASAKGRLARVRVIEANTNKVVYVSTYSFAVYQRYSLEVDRDCVCLRSSDIGTYYMCPSSAGVWDEYLWNPQQK
jgi:hypothetical protein